MARGAASSHPPTLTLPRKGGEGKKEPGRSHLRPFPPRSKEGNPTAAIFAKGRGKPAAAAFFPSPFMGEGGGGGGPCT